MTQLFIEVYVLQRFSYIVNMLRRLGVLIYPHWEASPASFKAGFYQPATVPYKVLSKAFARFQFSPPYTIR